MYPKVTRRPTNQTGLTLLHVGELVTLRRVDACDVEDDSDSDSDDDSPVVEIDACDDECIMRRGLFFLASASIRML